jgi:hypothetical protein
MRHADQRHSGRGVSARLLTLVIVAGLNVALVKRRLIRQVPFDPAAAIEMLERVETAHRSIVVLHATQGS